MGCILVKGNKLDMYNSIDISKYARREFANEIMTTRYLKEYDRAGNSNKKQRILLIDVNCKNSSTGNIVYDLYCAARADGRNASICYGRGEIVEGEYIYKFGLDWETYIHAALSRITGYNGCFSPLSTKRLIKYINEFKPDIIHIHELHAYFVNIKVLINYIKKKKIPLVWTFHCEYMYTGKCGHALECDRFKLSCGDCPHVRDYPKSLLFDKSAQMLRQKKEMLKDLDFKIITPSKWLADRVEMSFLKEKPISVIHNGIDISVFYPRADINIYEILNIDDEKKIIVSVAHNIMSEAKGGRYIVDLACDDNNRNLQYILVGVEDSNVESDWTKTVLYNSEVIKYSVKCYNNGNKVYFVSPIKNKDLMACLYSAADIFLLTSVKETYSLPCAEALCCGTPVIGFKSGAPETISLPPYSVFVPYGEMEKLKEQIGSSLLY